MKEHQLFHYTRLSFQSNKTGILQRQMPNFSSAFYMQNNTVYKKAMFLDNLELFIPTSQL